MLDWFLINLFQMLVGLNILTLVGIGIAMLVNIRDIETSKRCLKVIISCIMIAFVLEV